MWRKAERDARNNLRTSLFVLLDFSELLAANANVGRTTSVMVDVTVPITPPHVGAHSSCSHVLLPRHVLHVRIAADLYAVEPPFGRCVGRAARFPDEHVLEVVPLATVEFLRWDRGWVEIRGALTLAVGDDSLQQDTRLQTCRCPSPKWWEPRGWTRR